MGRLPKQIIVGFRQDGTTYTGKLGGIGELIKEGVSKQRFVHTWSDSKIPLETFDNVPTEGFVLNKKVGGDSWSWNPRQIKTRVFDPRGFEFEISMNNLLYILENVNSVKGKGFDGEFVYYWNGNEGLMLLPIDSEIYRKEKGVETFIQNNKPLSKKELIKGNLYSDQNGLEMIYLGKGPFKEIGRYSNVLMNLHYDKHMFIDKSNQPKLTFKPYTNLGEYTGKFEGRKVIKEIDFTYKVGEELTGCSILDVDTPSNEVPKILMKLRSDTNTYFVRENDYWKEVNLDTKGRLSRFQTSYLRRLNYSRLPYKDFVYFKVEKTKILL